MKSKSKVKSKQRNNKNNNNNNKVKYDNSPMECNICHAILAGRVSLYQHQQGLHGEKVYICFYCNKTANRKDHIMQHVKCVHSNNPGNYRQADVWTVEEKKTKYNRNETR